MKESQSRMIRAMEKNDKLARLLRIESHGGYEWIGPIAELSSTKDFSENTKYYLCLPEYVDACLWFLNGGTVQADSVKINGSKLGSDWYPTDVFMDDGWDISIVNN